MNRLLEPRGRAFVNRVCWGVAGGCLLLHFFVVLSHSVNVPFWDDWEALKPGALDHSLHWRWLIAFHNSHRVVLTNLSIWLLYRLAGWNLNAQIVLNFLVYAIMAVGVLRHLEKSFGVGMGAIALFPASAIASESHIHAANGQWTFFLLGFFLSMRLALRRDRAAWLAPLCAILGCYSMSGGMVCTLFFIAFSIVLAVLRPELRWRHAVHAALAAGALSLWFIGYRAEPTPLTFPWQGDFWLYFASLVSLGFGYSRVNAFPGLVYLVLTLGLLCFGWIRWRRKEAAQTELWVALALTLGGLLACIATISVGRGWGGPDNSGRYGEVGLFVVPITWVLLRTALRRLATWPWAEATGVVLVTAGMLVPLHSFLRYNRIYDPEQARRLAGLRCLHEHYYRGGPAYCPDIYYDEATASLVEDRAVTLGLSFVAEHTPITH
jgi:hypothetical protein